MSVIYRGPIPDRNYTINDFYNHGVIITWFAKFKTTSGGSAIRCIFRSNGLLGEIRTCCSGNTYAVDVQWGWRDDACLTTECKSLREAKSILFLWFQSKGFSVSKRETDNDWNKNYLVYSGKQLNLNPFIFR